MTPQSRLSRARRQAPDTHSTRDRWLVSYADFITLLFAFFTTMYAISTVDNQKLNVMVESMRTAFDAKKFESPKTPPPRAANSPRPNDAPASPEPPGTLDELKNRLSKRLEAQISGGQVGLEVDPRGLVITIREAGVFQIGSADLSPAARTVLREVADAMMDVDNPVRIEGHTDSVPIHTARFSSNWELSTARATTVIAFFVQERGLSPTRFSAAGYAEFHPRVASNTTDARAQNRRVDIVILNDATRKAEEPAVASAFTPLPPPRLPPPASTAPPQTASIAP